jgi:hypothetical protein
MEAKAPNPPMPPVVLVLTGVLTLLYETLLGKQLFHEEQVLKPPINSTE